MSTPLAWYLIRTKPRREQYVHEELSRVLPEVFLPMLKSLASRAGRPGATAVPLFPQYLFARFDITMRYYAIRYMPGVVGFVSAGQEPLSVPQAIVDSIRSRCRDGVVEARSSPFRSGERVRVIEGLFCGFEGIFEEYLSGTKRVAILLDIIGGNSLRMVLGASAVARQAG
jgi:transcriptional antiterminator RfaH